VSLALSGYKTWRILEWQVLIAVKQKIIVNSRPDPVKLRRLARRLRLAVDVSAGVLVIVAALAVSLPASMGSITIHLRGGGLPRAWAAGLEVFIALLLLAGLVELHRMFNHVARGAAFTLTVTRHFRRFTLLLTVAAAGNIVLPWLIELWLGYAAGRDATLSLRLDDVFPLLFAGLFYFVAEAFDQAAAFETDSKAFI
jgi:hypothetical protein